MSETNADLELQPSWWQRLINRVFRTTSIPLPSDVQRVHYVPGGIVVELRNRHMYTFDRAGELVTVGFNNGEYRPREVWEAAYVAGEAWRFQHDGFIKSTLKG